MSASKGFGNMFAPDAKDFDIAVSKALHKLQYKHRIKQTAIAKRIDVHRTTISNAAEQRYSLCGWAALRLVYEYAEEFPDAVAPIVEMCGPAAFRAADDSKAVTALRSIKDIVEAAGVGEA